MKNIFLLLAFVTISNLSLAQISYGVKGGLNISAISFSNESYETSPRVGFHLGGFGNYSLNEQLSLQAELFYSGEGNKWEFQNGTEGIIRQNQLRIPILVKFKIGDKLFLEAGPQYTILLSITQSIDNGDFDDIKSFYKSGNLGYALGASYDLENLLPGLAAGLRYNGGFGQITKSSVDGGELRNSVIQVNVFYTLSK